MSDDKKNLNEQSKQTEDDERKRCFGCGEKKPEGRNGPYCGLCDDPKKVGPSKAARLRLRARRTPEGRPVQARGAGCDRCDRCRKKTDFLHLMEGDPQHRGQWWCNECAPHQCARCGATQEVLVERLPGTDSWICERCLDRKSSTDKERNRVVDGIIDALSMEVTALNKRLRESERTAESLRRRVEVVQQEVDALRRINGALFKFVEVTETHDIASKVVADATPDKAGSAK